MLRWIGIEQQAKTLETNWREQRPILEQQLLLLDREQEELTAILENSQDIRDEAEARRLKLLEEQTRLEREQNAVAQTIAAVVVDLETVYDKLPPPLRDAWSQRIPRLRGELLSSSERLQLIVDLLTQLDDFQNKITLHEAILSSEEGSPYLVRQVYLGLSHGWYVSADGSRAARGYPTEDGWRWRPSDDAETISEFIAIVEGERPAALISVPVELVPPPTEGSRRP